jgi:hypothetical protein
VQQNTTRRFAKEKKIRRSVSSHNELGSRWGSGEGGGTLIKSDTKHPFTKILEKIKRYAKLVNLSCQKVVMVTPLREKTEILIYLGNGNL